MSHGRIWLTTLLSCIVGLTAEESRTGIRPHTPEEQAWVDRHVVSIDAVVANRMAWQRVREERALAQGMPMHRDSMPEGTAEVRGVSADGSTRLSADGPMALPVAVDNSREAWFPPVRNQGSLDSCVAFSQGYYGMTYMVNRALRRAADTDDYRMSPRFIYNLGNGGSDSGMGSFSALIIMARHGAATWADFPYTSDWKALPTSGLIWRKALRHRIGNVGAVPSLDSPAGLAIAKQLLANGHLLFFDTYALAWVFSTLSDNPVSGSDDGLAGRRVATHRGKGAGPHAMVIVGYNDDAWVDINRNGRVDSGETGALKVVNSWGTGWGDQGFAYVAYDALGQGSLVDGANQPNRSGGIIFGVRWADLRRDPTPSLVAEIDLSTAWRSDLSLAWRATATDQTSFSGSGDGTWQFYGAWSFDGQTSGRAGTVAIDLSDLPSAGVLRRFLFRLGDGTHAANHSLLGFRLYDGTGGLIASASKTEPSGGFPIVADAAAGRPVVHGWTDVATPDGAPPGTIDDLAVTGRTPTGLSLTFSASGDDGNRGSALRHEILWSDLAFSLTDVAGAKTLSVMPAARVPAGSTLTASLGGLVPGTTYWVAVRAIDDAGHVSPITKVSTAITPMPLQATSESVARGMVGVPYRRNLAVGGGVLPLKWALTPRMEERIGIGGSLINGQRLSEVKTTIALPFPFPVQTIDGTVFAERIQAAEGGLLFSMVPGRMDRPAGESLFTWHVLNLPSAIDGTGEGVFTAAENDRFTILWRAHPLGASGKDGSIAAQATLFPDGQVRFTYAAQSGTDGATIGIRHPEFPGGFASWLSVLHGAPGIQGGTTSTWTPNRLPPGLIMDSMTGTISGTPTESGTHVIRVTVTDGGIPRQRLDLVRTLHIDAAPDTANRPPVITKAPTAVVTGGTLSGGLVATP